MQTLSVFTKLVSLSAMAASLLASPDTFAAGRGNGSGYGGPTTETISIPAQAGRDISLEDFYQAYRTCMFVGDKSKGIQSFLSTFTRYVYGVDLDTEYASFGKEHSPSAEYWHAHLTGENAQGPLPLDFTASISKRDVRINKKGELEKGLFFHPRIYEPESLIQSLWINLSAHNSVPDVTLESEKIPFEVKVQSTEERGAYDSWGGVVAKDLILHGITINKTQNAFTFVNLKTRQPVKGLSIPVDDTILCLQTLLQESAQ